MKAWTTKRRLVLVVAALLFVACLAVVAWFVLSKQKPVGYDTNSPEYAELQERLKEPVPGSDTEKVNYYRRLGLAYYGLKDYNKALTNLEKADGFIQDRSVETGMSVNYYLATTYEALGRGGDAKRAYQREIDRIKNSTLAGDNQEAITTLEKKRDAVR